MSKRQQPPSQRSQLRNVALFKDSQEQQKPPTIPIDKITLPEQQPRRYFDSEAMKSLVESVKKEGILQPLLVRPVGKNYELVAGERRYRAACEVGLTEVPVVIKEMSQEQAYGLALTENLQRENLNPVEETEGILQLLILKLSMEQEEVISLLHQLANQKRGLTDNVVRSEKQQQIEEVFATLGKLSCESFRSHRLPLLNLPEEILEALRQGKIQYTKAKAIAKVKDEEQREALLTEVISEGLSLRQIKERIGAKAAIPQLDTPQASIDKTV
ncbi:MAG: ParB/RepB/Spo0J family partition protein, partial [Spirulinaceae cyanobacterium]